MQDPNSLIIHMHTKKDVVSRHLSSSSNFTQIIIDDYDVDNKIVNSFIKKSSNIEKFTLRRTPKITYEILLELAKVSSKLKIVYLTALDEMKYIGYVATIFSTKKTLVMPALRELKVIDCYKLLDIVIDSPMLNELRLVNLPALKELEINNETLEILELDKCGIFKNLPDLAIIKKINSIFGKSLYTLRNVKLVNVFLKNDYVKLFEKFPALMALNIWTDAFVDNKFDYFSMLVNYIDLLNSYYSRLEKLEHKKKFFYEIEERVLQFQKIIVLFQNKIESDKNNQIKNTIQCFLKKLLEKTDNKKLKPFLSFEPQHAKLKESSSREDINIRQSETLRLGTWNGKTSEFHTIFDALMKLTNDSELIIRQSSIESLFKVAENLLSSSELFSELGLEKFVPDDSLKTNENLKNSNSLKALAIDEKDIVKSLPDVESGDDPNVDKLCDEISKLAIEKKKNGSVQQSMSGLPNKGERTKIKSGLKNEEKIKNMLSTQVFSGFTLGKAIDNGDCFFDALGQILNIINNTDINTNKYLRMLCHDFYLKNKELVDKWNKDDYGGIDKGIEDYYFVQYTAEECDINFINRSPIWGRSYIEGKILCSQLNLKAICIIELLEDPNTKLAIPSYHLVNKENYESISESDLEKWLQNAKIPCLVVEQSSLHFVPLFGNNAIDIKASQAQLNENSSKNIPFQQKAENKIDLATKNDAVSNENENEDYICKLLNKYTKKEGWRKFSTRKYYILKGVKSELLDTKLLLKSIFSSEIINYDRALIIREQNVKSDNIKKLESLIKNDNFDQINKQIDSLRLRSQNDNKCIEIKRLFGSQLPIERCTELTLVEHENKLLSVADILTWFKDKSVCRILIGGDPGVGKTTLLNILTKKISEEISKESDTTTYHFKWVLQVPFEKLQNNIYALEKDMRINVGKFVSEECFSEDKYPEINALKSLYENINLWYHKLYQMLNSGEILLILDGYENTTENNKIYEILNHLFKFPYVMVTSNMYTLRIISDLIKFNKTVLVEGFSQPQIEIYINDYLSAKKNNHKNYAALVIEFLKTKHIFASCRLPFILESVCHMLIGEGIYVDESRLNRIKEDFYGQLIICFCRRYITKFTTIEEIIQNNRKRFFNPLFLTQEDSYNLCKYEIGFLECFAFSMITLNINKFEISFSQNYIYDNLKLGSQTVYTLPPFSKVQLDFGFLIPSEKYNLQIEVSGFSFRSEIFKNYFAAKFVASILQNTYNPKAINRISPYIHSWSNLQLNKNKTIEEYIKSNSSSIHHKPVWEFVIDILKNDSKTLAIFNDLAGNICIKEDTLKPLKGQLENLPSEYAFNLSRINPNELEIKCFKFGIKKNNILISLYTTLKIFIEQNQLDKIIKLEINDDNDKVIIHSDNPKAITTIAINLRCAAGQLLEKIPESHQFFTGLKEDRSTPKVDINEPSLISCSIQ